MKLDRIYRQLWDCLIAATCEGQRPFKAMQAATIGLDGAPNVRTVELRRVSEPENLITFHTDVRSPKVAELRREPKITLVGVETDRNRQIRVFGKSRILRDGAARLDAWESSSDRTLILYRTLLAPGTPICQPRDAFGEDCGAQPSDEGLAHFCVVEVSPFRIDWLDLSAVDGPERVLFIRNGSIWEHSWIAP